jgi:antirestriction protein ArdC
MKTEQAKQIIDDQLEQLSQALAAGRSDQLQEFLSTMAKFHNYSLGNTLLIMCQKPEATKVAGFHAWKDLGRSVKKGEKGIAILAPMLFKNREAEEAPEPESGEERIIRFRVVYVFDISQTEGEDLPQFARPDGEPGDYLDKLRALISDLDIALEYREDLGGAEGLSSGGLIAIKQGLTAAEEFSTLVHELTHEQLHKGELREGTTLQNRELEAEAVAYVVSQCIGLNAGTASSDYIQLYNGSKETLAQSLDAIRSTSGMILQALFKDHSDTAAAKGQAERPAKSKTASPSAQPALQATFEF